MAIPNAPSFASFDVTARTEGRAVDSVLWDYMFAKSRLLEVIGTGPKINQQRYEWVNIGSTAITVTAEDTSNTTFDSSTSGTGLEVSVADAAKLMPGALLMNVSRATPIGTYQRNELLQVVTVDEDTGVCVLARDIGAFNSGTGSSSHAATDVLRLIATPHQEGSVASLDPNAYSAQSILENYTAIQTVKLQATGSQMARDMEVVASDLERQYAREMLNLKNQLVGLFSTDSIVLRLSVAIPSSVTRGVSSTSSLTTSTPATRWSIIPPPRLPLTPSTPCSSSSGTTALTRLSRIRLSLAAQAVRSSPLGRATRCGLLGRKAASAVTSRSS